MAEGALVMDEYRVRVRRDDGHVENEVTFLGGSQADAIAAVMAMARSRPDPERWAPQVFRDGEWWDAWRPD
jgi:hypothetical protein